jgi:hypothetical protein
MKLKALLVIPQFWRATLLGASAIINVSLWLLARFLFPQETPAAILHYSAGTGIDFIGEGDQIVVLPLIGTIVWVGNSILGFTLMRASPTSAWLLWASTLVMECTLLLAFFLLLRINA